MILFSVRATAEWKFVLPAGPRQFPYGAVNEEKTERIRIQVLERATIGEGRYNWASIDIIFTVRSISDSWEYIYELIFSSI